MMVVVGDKNCNAFIKTLWPPCLLILLLRSSKFFCTHLYYNGGKWICLSGFYIKEKTTMFFDQFPEFLLCLDNFFSKFLRFPFSNKLLKSRLGS